MGRYKDYDRGRKHGGYDGDQKSDDRDPKFGLIIHVRAPRRSDALLVLRRSKARPLKVLVPLKCTRPTRDLVLSRRPAGEGMSSSTPRRLPRRAERVG